MQIPTVIGPYAVVDRLGEGGMGEVFLARHRELGVERALKVLAPSEGADSARRAERFAREVRALSQIQHPNVVRVYDCGEIAGRLYFVMDRIAGKSLAQVIKDGSLDLERALDLAAGIARGVEALHTAGIVHRDLKPDNVVVTPDGRPVVLDLGLALAPETDERLTRTGTMVGTPAYMAPEQLDSSAEVTPRIDVYALGLILFELCTGKGAVDLDSGVAELLGRIIHQDRPVPSSVNSNLPAALDALCARATSRDATQRHPDAGALADAIEALRTAPGSSARLARLKRWAAAATTLAIVSCVVTVLALKTPSPQTPPVDAPPPSAAPVEEQTQPALDTRAIAKGRRRLRKLRRLPAKERFAGADAWLKDYPGHPESETAIRLRLKARHSFPLARFEAEGLTSGVLLQNGRAVTGGSLLRLWDVAAPAGPQRLETLNDLTSGLFVPAADKGSIFTCGAQSLRRVDLDGKVVGSWSCGKASALAVDAAAERFAVGEGSDVRVYSLSDGELLQTLGPHRGTVTTLAFSGDGKRLVVSSGSTDIANMRGQILELHVWSVVSGTREWSATPSGQVSALAVTPDNSRVFVGDDAGRISVFSIENLERVGVLVGPTRASPFDPVPPAHLLGVQSIALTQDGKTVFSSSGGTRTFQHTEKTGNGIAVWNAETREHLGTREFPSQVYQVSVSADGEHLLVVGKQWAEVWSAVDPALLGQE